MPRYLAHADDVFFDKKWSDDKPSPDSSFTSVASTSDSWTSTPPKWRVSPPLHRNRRWRQRACLFLACTALLVVLRKILAYSKPTSDPTHQGSPKRVEPSSGPSRCIRPPTALLQSSCEPYQLRGLLHADPDSATANRWSPFDPTCQPVDWMSQLQSAAKNKSTIPPGISWVKDKTIVLFGSSIDRFLVRDMCAHLGIRHTTIGQSHPAYPPTPAYFQQYDPPPVGHDLDNIAGVPTMCFVPHLNFSVISVYHYGLESKDEQVLSMLMEKKQYHPPAFIHDRFDHILLPLLKRLGRKLDLLQFASFLWDVQFLHRRDKRADGLYPHSVKASDVDIYGLRLEQAFLRIAARLPSSVPILWRTPHAIKASSDAFLPPRIAVALATMAESVVERITGMQWAPLHSMAAYTQRHACHESRGKLMGRVKPSQFGNVIKGFEHLQRDDIHPGPALNWVGANILLHELHSSVTQVRA